MANFKRRKPKREVRCPHCTQFNYFGNGKGRFSGKEEDARKRAAKDAREYRG